MPIPQAYLGATQAPSSIKNFYFICHGATDLNEKVKEISGQKHWGVQGSGTNIGLNARGKRQAFLAGNVVRTLPKEGVVCSPLLRVLQTVFFANIRCPQFNVDEKLQERDFGEHEGGYGPLSMFEDNYPDCEDNENISIHVAKALKNASNENTLFIAHGGVLRVFGALLRVDLTNEHTDNGHVLYFSREGSNWKVEVYQSPVILVSWPTHGIGKAIAENLILHGYRLSLGTRNLKDLEATFGPPDHSLHYAHFDVQEQDTMKGWVDAAVEKFGRIDGLVNSACGREPINLVHDIYYKWLQTLWDVNYVARLRMTELCLPYLNKAGSGRIVNINSMSNQCVVDPFVGYNMTMHAVGGLTKKIHHVCWDHGVRAADISIGFAATLLSALTALIGNKEMIQLKDIANLVVEALERPNRAYVI